MAVAAMTLFMAAAATIGSSDGAATTSSMVVPAMIGFSAVVATMSFMAAPATTNFSPARRLLALRFLPDARKWKCKRMTSNLPEIVGVLLAGGQARRMGGGEKYLLPLQGRPLLAHAIERARPQVTSLLLNAAGDPKRLSAFGLPVACDVVEGHAGPLAGILTGMEWALQNAPQCRWIATFAADTPFFPMDMVRHLWAAVEAEEADLARATSADQPQPVFGLWPVALAPDLRRALTEEGARKITAWTACYRTADVAFPAEPIDPFFNINQPQDLTRLEALLKKAGKEKLA